MDPSRFATITGKYPNLHLAVVGDFCLDRYLEIDPAKQEMSIETGLPVHNVVRVRAQPGGAGTIFNNLVALGVGAIYPVGFSGVDGEGSELRAALQAKTGVHLDHFQATPERRTFTYCKPLVVQTGQPPVELNRLDSKNWTPTPPSVQERVIHAIRTLGAEVDAILVLDQVDLPETGVVTRPVLEALGQLAQTRPELLIIADSRRGLRGFPAVCFKMNRAELAALTGTSGDLPLPEVRERARTLARQNGQPVFVTLANDGILGASSAGDVEHVAALPVRGQIDIVGAGDAVTANLATSLAAGATLREVLEIANAAASIVIHQLGTTGTASVSQIAGLITGAVERRG